MVAAGNYAANANNYSPARVNGPNVYVSGGFISNSIAFGSSTVVNTNQNVDMFVLMNPSIPHCKLHGISKKIIVSSLQKLC